MSDAQVPVTLRCDRTGRQVTLTMPVGAVKTLLGTQASKTTNAAAIRKIFKALPNAVPDLVVYYRGKLVILNTVFELRDLGLKKALHEITRSSLFPVPDKRPRKTKSKQGKRDSAPPVCSESV